MLGRTLENTRDRGTTFLLAALALASAVLLLRHHSAIPLLQVDSARYLSWDVTVTPGYPLFLWVTTRVVRGLPRVPYVQFALFFAAAFAFARAAAPLLRSRLLAAGLLLSIVANPQLVRYSFTILTESLFMSCVMLHLACALTYLRGGHDQRRLILVLAGVTIGAAIIIRPAGYSLLLSLPVLLYDKLPRVRTAAAYVVAPIVAILLGVSTANYASRGVFATQVFDGYNLIGQAALLIDEKTPADPPQLAASIASDLAGIRAALDNVHSLWAYYQVSANEHNRILWDIVLPRIRNFANTAPGVEQERIVNQVGRTLAIRAILAHPARYAYHVAAQLYGLWTLPTVSTANAAAASQSTLDELARRFPALSGAPVVFLVVPRLVVIALKALLLTVFVLSVCWLVTLLKGVVNGVERPPLSRLLVYASAMVHANFLLVAAVQAGVPRYALSFWPVEMLILSGTAAVVWHSRFLSSLRRARRPTNEIAQAPQLA